MSPKPRNPKKVMAQLRQRVADVSALMTELAVDHNIQVDLATSTVAHYGDACLHNRLTVTRISQVFDAPDSPP